MDNDLDENLTTIVQDGQPIALVVEEIVADIKQAFKEAGYSKVSLQQGTSNSFYFAGDMEAFKEANGLMTGQEFYNRFEKELEGKIFPHHCINDQVNVVNTLEACRLAARRAAGLKESETE